MHKRARTLHFRSDPRFSFLESLWFRLRCSRLVIRSLLAAALLVGAGGVSADSGGQTRVNVILWFDTEDYLLPADDDATLRLAEMLTQRGVRATFKMVGEKARVLERRSRQDVITALKKHDIGYHTDFHSVHPTPTEYLADCGLTDGMAEFVRRESGGAADVRRIFGLKTLACYGQPGSSWAPQATAALAWIGVASGGVPCYVDEGDQVSLEGKPFWYAGALSVFGMSPNWTRMDLHDPQVVEPAKQKVAAIAERLAKEDGGGLISIFYHPCEWVHQEFWDGVNFRRGANPPREQWRRPPQRPEAETEAAFQRFGDYIDFIRKMQGVRFVTASELPDLYRDGARMDGCSATCLSQLAHTLCEEGPKRLDFRVLGQQAYSCADQFELLLRAVEGLIDGKAPQFPVRLWGLLGPEAAPPPSSERTRLDWPAFRDAVKDLGDFVRANKRLPSRVFVGAEALPPADFLCGLASVWGFYSQHGRLPTTEGVPIASRVELLPARHVAEDTPGLFGGWIIHKEGFRAPRLMDLARLQAWTLKPAVRVKD